MLAKYGKKIARPTEKEFASAIPQSHRKGEKAWHVKAHRGTKEGYLWFLSTGILFGFKKPIAFFPFTSIDSISYTSTRPQSHPKRKEIEFSMLDQQDFAGIDEYVKRHGLNDASMAAQRRAKMYNVNKEKKGDGEEGAEGMGREKGRRRRRVVGGPTRGLTAPDLDE
ncbi:Histone chaperone [Hortaea werneckii EXF-2000]|uniref:Histone chaperone n=1 Tax=Hortaea werneckii EXF-2000 TaxID=1157616 RepID=A0A1Z5SN34_HORWE|nr:Histone chaperone [Hortaea werneckii EXF-2000]